MSKLPSGLVGHVTVEKDIVTYGSKQTQGMMDHDALNWDAVCCKQRLVLE